MKNQTKYKNERKIEAKFKRIRIGDKNAHTERIYLKKKMKKNDKEKWANRSYKARINQMWIYFVSFSLFLLLLFDFVFDFDFDISTAHGWIIQASALSMNPWFPVLNSCTSM